MGIGSRPRRAARHRARGHGTGRRRARVSLAELERALSRAPGRSRAPCSLREARRRACASAVARSTSIPGSSIWARRFTSSVCRSWRCSTSSNGSTRSHGETASRYVGLFEAHVWEPFVADGMTGPGAERVANTISALREAAIAVVAGVFRQAIDAAAGDAVARHAQALARNCAHRKAKPSQSASRVPPAPWRRKGAARKLTLPSGFAETKGSVCRTPASSTPTATSSNRPTSGRTTSGRSGRRRRRSSSRTTKAATRGSLRWAARRIPSGSCPRRACRSTSSAGTASPTKKRAPVVTTAASA